MTAKDMMGQTCGRLFVVERAGTLNNGRAKKTAAWLCRCSCGSMVRVRGSALRNGSTTSCGCAWRDWADGSSKHGCARKASRSKEYDTWAAMKARCTNKNNKEFARYGGRGITICASWMASFEQFLADMGEKPSSSHSIERIDHNGNYSPENCRWATTVEQSRNKRNNRWITANGKTMLIGDWAKEIGLEKSSIYLRIRKGWSEQMAVLTPGQPGKHVERRS